MQPWHDDEVHELQDVPRYPPAASLDSETLQAVDRMTRSDGRVYTVAVTTFLRRLCDAQRATGRQLVCPQRVAALLNTTAHLNDISVPSECLTLA